MRTRSVSLIAVLVLLSPCSAFASGSTTDPISATAGASDGSVSVVAQRAHAGTGGLTTAGAHRAAVTVLLPACNGNEPDRPAPYSQVMCMAAVSGCATSPVPNAVLYWVFTQQQDGSWRLTGQRCLTPAQAAAARVTPAFTVTDFRRLPLPPAGLVVQPPSLRTLVNIPTNFYARSAPVTLTATVLGVPVTVHATPASFTWTYGDGTQRTTTDPGHPFPTMTTPHTYNQPATVTVTLTTTYSGTYRLPGGTWIPVDGTATVTSPPVQLQVQTAHAVLVG